jgi:hypothetical protein
MSYKQVPRTQVVGIHKAPQELTYAQQPQTDVETIIERTSASQYLVLDSKNRFFNAQPQGVQFQPWNNFRLQKGQSLMESFATRLTISEIRFPWFIPNITTNNQIFYITGNTGDPTILTSRAILIDSKYYKPSDLADEINSALANQAPTIVNKPELSYDSDLKQFLWTNLLPNSTDYCYITWKRPTDYLAPDNSQSDEYNYNSTPSLLKTLGFNYNNVFFNPLFPIRSFLQSNPTETLYTTYVDIISDKLNQYTTNLDGSSDSTSNRLLLRLYLADECSFPQSYNVDGATALYSPFLIHRQFKNPKQVMWNKESVVDWLDISVRDEYGLFIPLPQVVINTSLLNPNKSEIVEGAYPDFQITLLATEN